MRMITAIVEHCNLIFILVHIHTNVDDLAEIFCDGDDDEHILDKARDLFNKAIFIIRGVTSKGQNAFISRLQQGLKVEI